MFKLSRLRRDGVNDSADMGWMTAMVTRLALFAVANCMAALADFSESGDPSVGTRIFLNMVFFLG